VDSCIPLMGPLTREILERAKGFGEEETFSILGSLTGVLKEEAHIEHMVA